MGLAPLGTHPTHPAAGGPACLQVQVHRDDRRPPNRDQASFGPALRWHLPRRVETAVLATSELACVARLPERSHNCLLMHIQPSSTWHQAPPLGKTFHKAWEFSPLPPMDYDHQHVL